jgi:hypothetical protein
MQQHVHYWDSDGSAREERVQSVSSWKSFAFCRDIVMYFFDFFQTRDEQHFFDRQINGASG